MRVTLNVLVGLANRVTPYPEPCGVAACAIGVTRT